MKLTQLPAVNVDLPSSELLDRYCFVMETTLAKTVRDGLRFILIEHLKNPSINPTGLTAADLFPNPVMGRPKKPASVSE